MKSTWNVNQVELRWVWGIKLIQGAKINWPMIDDNNIINVITLCI